MIYLEAVMKKLFLLLPLVLFIGCASTPKVSLEEWTSNPDNLVAVYCMATKVDGNWRINKKMKDDTLITVCKVSEASAIIEKLYDDDDTPGCNARYYVKPYSQPLVPSIRSE